MKNLSNFTVEFENGYTGMLFQTEDIKKLKLSNSEAYPVTEHIVNEYKKALSKEILKTFKKESHFHTMVTVYGWERGYYDLINICRFTFYAENGNLFVEYRPYHEHNGFEVAVTEKFDTNVKAKNYMLQVIESYLYENIKVRENKANYFTKNV